MRRKAALPPPNPSSIASGNCTLSIRKSSILRHADPMAFQARTVVQTYESPEDQLHVKVTRLEIPGLLLIEPALFHDARGLFCETYHARRYAEAGLSERFVQDNFSRSVRGTLRGLHFQEPQAQGKLVMVLEGAVYDVVVDIRKGSPAFGRWQGVDLSSENYRQLYVPTGCAHGFCVTSDHAAVLYKCTEFYSPPDERGIIWNDPALAISWPVPAPLLSAKDQAYRTLAAMDAQLPRYRPPTG
jgi:dTDP-4-dehydrorhamnose 3,5-epimerase